MTASKQFKVFLNAGHGGVDAGAQGNGMLEKVINLEVVLQVGTILLRHPNVLVNFSRKSDVYMKLQAIDDMANSWGADLFVSVHHNAAGVPSADGAEGYHSVFGDRGTALVDNIMAEFKAIGQNIRKSNEDVGHIRFNGAHTDDYYGILRGLASSVSGVLIEFGFIDTVDSRIFDSPAERTKEAEGIAKGILKTLGIAYVPVVPAPQPVPVVANGFLVGQAVVVKTTAKTYATGQNMASFVKGNRYIITQLKSDRALLSGVMSWVRLGDLQIGVMPVPKPARKVIWITTKAKYYIRTGASVFASPSKTCPTVQKGTRLQVFSDIVSGTLGSKWYQLTNNTEYISSGCVK